jgi:hypothetical protein
MLMNEGESTDNVDKAVNQTAGGFYSGSEADPAQAYGSTERNEAYVPTDDGGAYVEWTASEFVDHQKTIKWFLGLGLFTIVLGVFVFLATNRDWFGPVIIAMLAIIFGVGAARKPRELAFVISAKGVQIGERLFAYEDLKSFSLMDEGSIEKIVLTPSKRWQPLLNLYFDPVDGDKIMDTLGGYLPYEERLPGLTDKFLHKIRF